MSVALRQLDLKASFFGVEGQKAKIYCSQIKLIYSNLALQFILQLW